MESSQSSTMHTSSSTPCPVLNSNELQPEVEIDAQHESASNTISSSKSKTKKARSMAWDHCTRFEKFYEKRNLMWPFAKCNYCQIEMPCHSVHNGTHALVKHFKDVCVNCLAYEGGSKSKGQTTLTQETMGAPLVPHAFNQKRIEEKVYKWIIKDEHSFRAVEGVGYIEMVTEMVPRFVIPGRNKVAGGILDLYVLEKAKIKSVIGDQRISITTDTWTSIQNINYMVVTAHFMDSDWKLHKRILNFTKITSHKGEYIGRTLEHCLRSWGIDKVFSIKVDNASANDGAVRYMADRLKEIDTLLFDGMYLHMRCSCHILNLIVKDGLEELQESVEAIRNCVKYIHSSPPRLDKFREFAVLLKLGEMANVPLDVATRWNSTYKMLKFAAKYKMVFKRMLAEYTPFLSYFLEKDKKGKPLRVGPPLDDDWEKVNAIVHFLKIFYDATLVLSATKTCTSTLLFDQISNLQLDIKERMDDHTNHVLSNVAYAMMIKFNKYWGDFEQVNKLVYVAHVLNPRMKLQMITTAFDELGKTDEEVTNIISAIKSCLLNLYNVYKGEASCIVRPSPSVEVIDEAGLSRLELKLKRKRMEEEAIEISNEVDKYLNDPFEKLDHKGFDLLEWWKCNQSWYPVLSKIAKDLFSIPASTVASENAFSLGGRIVDPFRASLTPRTVEALVCTTDWFKAQGFNFYKEPTDDQMEFYKELEEVENVKLGPQT